MTKQLGGFEKLPTILDAVEALTKPATKKPVSVTHEHEWATTDGHRICIHCDAVEGDGSRPWMRTTKPVTSECPLDQLENAVANSMGGNGGGKQARERTPMDFGAFQLYESIDGRIRAWLTELGAKPGSGLNARELLTTWHRLWIGGVHDIQFERYYIGVLEGWETAIKDRLDPPKRIEISAKCPICGKEWMNLGLKLADGSDDPDDIERVRVLNAVERETIDESFAICANCQTVWAGRNGMRQLRILIDDQEKGSQHAALG